jgi:hypothetical protein
MRSAGGAAQKVVATERLSTDSRGNLLDVSQLGRFPSDLLGLAVDLRDGTCRWPTWTPSGHRYTAETEPLPVGHWPSPVIADSHTPLDELIDLIDTDATGPPLDRSRVREALGPRAGSEPLVGWESDIIAEPARAP